MAPEEQPDRLGPDEVALVLRRAADLDLAAGQGTDEGMPVAALEAAAVEVGLPVLAVRQAVAELRAGALTSEGTSPPQGVVIEAGIVPLPPSVALALVGRWLQGQAFERHRVRDGAETWRQREDVFAKIQRSVDWIGHVRLQDVREVTVRAVAVQDGTLVRFEASLEGSVVARPGIGAGLGAVVGSGAGMVTAAALSVGTPAGFILGTTVAGAGAVGGWWTGRRSRDAHAAAVRDELSAHLDRVGHGDTANPGLLDRLRRRGIEKRHHHSF
jgi:hypothetical protein